MKRLTVRELIILAGISLRNHQGESVAASRGRSRVVDGAVRRRAARILLVPDCGTSVFLIITALTLIDVIAGFAVSLSTARRDIAIS